MTKERKAGRNNINIYKQKERTDDLKKERANEPIHNEITT